MGYRGDPCDDGCRAANGCRGFVECEECGRRLCSVDLDDRDLCPRCAERREEEDAEDASGDEADGEGGRL